MNYELAKQLKDAGFPQQGESYKGFYVMKDGSIIDKTVQPIVINNDVIEGIYSPTLSELIEACGDNFRNLERNDEGTFEAYPTREILIKNNGWWIEKSSSPEEAVAKLWLELNK